MYNDLQKAADHIQSVREAEEALEAKYKTEQLHWEKLHEYIAHEIRLAMQQETADRLNGLSRTAVAEIRAMRILNAIDFGIPESHVTEIPSDHIERRVSQLINQKSA